MMMMMKMGQAVQRPPRSRTKVEQKGGKRCGMEGGGGWRREEREKRDIC
jgi:hypothetical protein